jgi:thiamine biosynthesis protein ThiS
MQVSINGEPKRLPQACSVKEMLEVLQLDQDWLAVAINMEFVSKEKFEEMYLKEGDMVDILSPMSGG